MRFVAASDSALLVVADEGGPSPAASARVHALFRALRSSDFERPRWLLDLKPAYTTLLIEFDLDMTDHAEVERYVAAQAEGEGAARLAAARATRDGRVPLVEPAMRAPPRPSDPSRAPREVELHVRYDGVDLEFVAEHTGLTIDDVISRHTAPRYTVAFLGFMPGFAYLLGLDEKLAVPRLDVPRKNVQAGAVAVGGSQTAVYPSSSPGGWRILGHIDRGLAPDWVEPGDVVLFRRRA